MTTNTIRFCKKCQAETERLASGGRCKPCSNASSKAYSKAWRIENPDKSKANNDAWRAANPEKVKASGKAWRNANLEKSKETSKAWKAANPEKHRASVKAAQLAKAAKFSFYEAFYLARQCKLIMYT